MRAVYEDGREIVRTRNAFTGLLLPVGLPVEIHLDQASPGEVAVALRKVHAGKGKVYLAGILVLDRGVR